MLMDGRQRREVEPAPDFFEARRIPVVLDELVQVIEDFTLPFGEREHFIPPSRSRWRDYNANRRRRSSRYHGLHQGDAGPTLEKPAPENTNEASIVRRDRRLARGGGRSVAEPRPAGRGDFQTAG